MYLFKISIQLHIQTVGSKKHLQNKCKQKQVSFIPAFSAIRLFYYFAVGTPAFSLRTASITEILSFIWKTCKDFWYKIKEKDHKEETVIVFF